MQHKMGQHTCQPRLRHVLWKLHYELAENQRHSPRLMAQLVMLLVHPKDSYLKAKGPAPLT